MQTRRVWIAVGAIVLAPALLFIQCVGDSTTGSDAATQGSLGGACYANSTCDPGLVCVVARGQATCALSDAGSEATTPDAADDGSVGEAAADASDAALDDDACPNAGPSGCETCCAQHHSNASAAFFGVYVPCTCDDAGACWTSCASNWCQNQPESPSCVTCAQTTCQPLAMTACNVYPDCPAWWTCMSACP